MYKSQFLKISVILLPALILTGILFSVFARQTAVTAPGLGTAASFAVLGGSTVTNTGSSVIDGNLGVWPGSAITGFPPGIVEPPGAILNADAVAAQAQSDLTAAYNALAGQACNTNLTGQDLGGMTLTPDVYCFDSSAQLTGALTLDALGNADAVFVFQIGSTLTTASNSSVLIINGGSGCNVFWQIGSSATLGTNTSFQGSILALTSITLNTGANITAGRALAQNGAVTLDTNYINSTVCTALPTATALPPLPTLTFTSTSTLIPTLIPIFTPIFTTTSIPTSTSLPDINPTSTPTFTDTYTPTFTPTFTPILTDTFTPTFTPTFTLTNTPTTTPTLTLTNAPTNTPTFTLTNTPTFTPTLTLTNTPTFTLTTTPTFTLTTTPTLTLTTTPTFTLTNTPTTTPTYVDKDTTPTPTSSPTYVDKDMPTPTVVSKK